MNSGKETQITNSDHTEIFPEWVPNKDKIIYSSGNSMNHNIYLASINKNKSIILSN